MVVLFVILLLLLGMYQAYAVPGENQEIEFQHSQEVRGDVLDLRNAVLDAKDTGRTRSAKIDLAPRYPSRIIGINPPPPSATLETTENSSIEVLNQDDDVVDVCPVTSETRMMEYEAAYNVYEENPVMRFENTVAYADFAEAVRPISGQRLVEGNRVNLVVLQPSYRETGSGVLSLDMRAGRLNERHVEDPTVSVPTRLDEDSWIELLDGEVAPADVSVSGGFLTLELDGLHRVSCGVVGTGTQPPGGERPTTGAGDVNPAGPDDVRFVSAEILAPGGGPPGGGPPGQEEEGNRNVRLTFENGGDEDAELTDARIAFYYQSPQPARPDITDANIYDSPTPPTNLRGNLEVQGPMVELSEPITFPAESQKSISMRFNVRAVENDFYVMTLRFSDGTSGLYFISMD